MLVAKLSFLELMKFCQTESAFKNQDEEGSLQVTVRCGYIFQYENISKLASFRCITKNLDDAETDLALKLRKKSCHYGKGF